MRLSKTAIHKKQLSAKRSAPQRRCAQLVLDINYRFIDGFIPSSLSGFNRKNLMHTAEQS
jgi:hypothetical protein